jgi:hypothetical protein
LHARGPRGAGAMCFREPGYSGAAKARLTQRTRGAQPQADAFAREVQCSLLLGATHVNVVRPHELLLTRRHAVLVTSYEAGGTLAAYCNRHRVDEPTACYFFRQLVAALAHCHAQAIAFRDVKLDNVLLDASQPPTLRLCDFGVARRWAATAGGNAHFSTLAGTPGYLSPQVLGVLFSPRGGAGYDGAAADVWSAGCVLAVMLLHRLPFSYDEVSAALDGTSALRTAWEQELRTRWRAGDAKLAAALSPQALDLLDRMLEPDEVARITLADVARHPWVRQPLPPPLEEALQRQAEAQESACCAASAADLKATDAKIEEIAQLARALGTAPPGVERVLSLVPEACRRRSINGPAVEAAEPVVAAWTEAPCGAGCARASSGTTACAAPEAGEAPAACAVEPAAAAACAVEPAAAAAGNSQQACSMDSEACQPAPAAAAGPATSAAKAATPAGAKKSILKSGAAAPANKAAPKRAASPAARARRP